MEYFSKFPTIKFYEDPCSGSRVPFLQTLDRHVEASGRVSQLRRDLKMKDAVEALASEDHTFYSSLFSK